MSTENALLKRIDRLPHKVGVPFRQLYQSGQINEDVLRTVLYAGEIACDNAKLLVSTIAYMQHRADGVPVHDRLSRAEALDKLSMENKCLNEYWFLHLVDARRIIDTWRVVDGRLVDVHVRRLRTKVEADPANPRHVVTVRGLGYRLQT